MTVEDPPSVDRVKGVFREGHGASGCCGPGVDQRGLYEIEAFVGARQVATSLIGMELKARDLVET